jgi:hypothetical protein
MSVLQQKKQLREARATLCHARTYLRDDIDALRLLYPAIGELSRSLAALNTGGAQRKIKHRIAAHWCGRCPDYVYEGSLRAQWLDDAKASLPTNEARA